MALVLHLREGRLFRVGVCVYQIIGVRTPEWFSVRNEHTGDVFEITRDGWVEDVWVDGELVAMRAGPSKKGPYSRSLWVSLLVDASPMFLIRPIKAENPNEA